MPDTMPSPEAIRLSNALDNLGAAALDLEGFHDVAERALIDVVRRVYELDPGAAAEVFGGLTRDTLKAIVRASVRYAVPVAFVEMILAQKEGFHRG